VIIIGADYHPGFASGGAQRKTALQEATLARHWTRATGIVCVSAVGQSTLARSAGVAGSTDSDDCRVDAGDRAGSGEVAPAAKRLQTHPEAILRQQCRVTGEQANNQNRGWTVLSTLVIWG
jgi:hypothetical protein